jgi:hypothetical protein
MGKGSVSRDGYFFVGLENLVIQFLYSLLNSPQKSCFKIEIIYQNAKS